MLINDYFLGYFNYDKTDIIREVNAFAGCMRYQKMKS